MASGKAWNRRIALLGGAAAATGAYFALSGPDRPSRRKVTDARTFLRGNAAEPQTLDPNLAAGTMDAHILRDLMMGLVTEDPRSHPVPGAATHWRTAADGLTWVFHLRDASWSDGVPVTAGDFVFSWRRILDPDTASPYAYFLYVIKNAAAVNKGAMPGEALGVKALDARTLEITLEHPAPYLLEMLSHSTMYPLPRHVVTARGKAWARAGSHVGNGAYVLKEWLPNGHVLVEKNPRFFDAANVAMEKVYYYPTDDYGAALQRFRAGELDIQVRLPGQQIDWIRKNIPQTIDLKPQLTVEYVAMNQTRPPFNDVRIRHAMNLALNREAITTRISRVGQVPAYRFVPPGTANFPGGNSLDFTHLPHAARVEKARGLMRAAGYGENNRLKTSYLLRGTGPGTARAVAAAIQQMFAQVYVDIAILPVDFPIFLAQTDAHDFDMAQAGWGADFNDAATFIELLQTGAGNNSGAYSNRHYDAALEASRHDTDLVTRGQKLAEAERIALADHAVLPLFFWANPNLVWPYVKGWETNAMDHHPSRWITVDQAARIRQFA
jgi:oligopeptide transport system substrate-binding protein